MALQSSLNQTPHSRSTVEHDRCCALVTLPDLFARTHYTTGGWDLNVSVNKKPSNKLSAVFQYMWTVEVKLLYIRNWLHIWYQQTLFMAHCGNSTAAKLWIQNPNQRYYCCVNRNGTKVNRKAVEVISEKVQPVIRLIENKKNKKKKDKLRETFLERSCFTPCCFSCWPAHMGCQCAHS